MKLKFGQEMDPDKLAAYHSCFTHRIYVKNHLNATVCQH